LWTPLFISSDVGTLLSRAFFTLAVYLRTRGISSCAGFCCCGEDDVVYDDCDVADVGSAVTTNDVVYGDMQQRATLRLGWARMRPLSLRFGVGMLARLMPSER